MHIVKIKVSEIPGINNNDVEVFGNWLRNRWVDKDKVLTDFYRGQGVLLSENRVEIEIKSPVRWLYDSVKALVFNKKIIKFD
jgi:hypothetical protein